MSWIDPYLEHLFSSGGWIILICVFGWLASRRPGLVPAGVRRFLILAAAALFWVLLSAVFSLQADLFFEPGRTDLASLLALLAAAPYLIYCFLFYKKLGHHTQRQRIVRGDFLTAFIISGVCGPGIELASILLSGASAVASSGDPDGHSFATQLRLWGPLVGTIPIVVPAFMLTVNPIMNVRRVALRALLYLGLCFLGSLVLFGAGSLYFYTDRGVTLPLWYLYFLFWVVSGAVTFLAFLHTRFLKVTIQFLFLRDVYRNEQELKKFIYEVQTLDSARESQEIVLELILQNLFGVFRFEKGFIVSVNRTGDLFVRTLGETEERVQEFQQYRPFMRRRLPPVFLEEMDRVFLLEDGVPLPFENTPERYDRVAGRIRDTASSLRDSGYEIFMPLIFHGEIWGLIFLGPRELPYYNGENVLLNNARPGYAMALRNRAVLEEIKKAAIIETQGGEDRVASSAAPVFVPSEIQRVKLGDRTLVYADPLMYTLVEKTRQIAAGYLPVLIQGETGTGKELVARLLHQSGPGSDRPFVAVNCAAIPASLWESEIFGYRKGAFTGAAADSPGLVEQAAGGVLFFDEIGEMPLEIQPKILRLIQEKSYRPVGGKKNMDASCRPIFATHRDLAAMSKEGTFREDLYYRINVHRVQVPALRERRPDIRLIIDQLFDRYADEPGMVSAAAEGDNGAGRELSPEALELMLRYDWPGNIRELENVFVRCLVESPGRVIEASDLPEEVRSNSGGTGPARPLAPTAGVVAEAGFEELMQDYARQIILRSLRESKGNQSKAARLLGISRGKLIYRMKELQIE